MTKVNAYKMDGLGNDFIIIDDRKEMFDALTGEGMKGFLTVRDGPFQPEPFGPRSNNKS